MQGREQKAHDAGQAPANETPNNHSMTDLSFELWVMILEELDDKALLAVNIVSQQFSASANEVFKNRLKKIDRRFFRIADEKLTGFQLTYFSRKKAFDDTVNAVIKLAFPQDIVEPDVTYTMRKHPVYLTPGQQLVDAEGDLTALYYFPLLKTIGTFDAFTVLQAVINKINGPNKSAYLHLSDRLFRCWDSPTLNSSLPTGMLYHLFIGTMRDDVIGFLWECGYDPFREGPFGSHDNHKEGDSAVDVMLAVSSYYQRKEHRKDHGPSLLTLTALSALVTDGASFKNGERYIKDILTILETEQDHALTPSCLRLCAFLFLIDKAGQYQEADFLKHLSKVELTQYELEKAQVDDRVTRESALRM